MTRDSGSPAGVILAAGRGRRILPFSETLPKPLLPIVGRPMIDWQIDTMRELGIEEILIVIGHLGARFREDLGDGASRGVRLRYVEQKEILGIGHAVARIEGEVDRPFLLFLGDIFFEANDLARMLRTFERDNVNAVLAVKEEPDVEALKRNFTVERDDEGRVTRVVEKPRTPRTSWKGCGIYLFDETVFDAARRTPRTAMRDEYELTDTIQILIDQGREVWSADVIERDVNLSEPADLLQLNLEVMRRERLEPGQTAFIAPDASVHDGASVRDSVVLAGARIEAGADLERCLVMPREHVRAGTYRDAIFTEGAPFSCA